MRFGNSYDYFFYIIAFGNKTTEPQHNSWKFVKSTTKYFCVHTHTHRPIYTCKRGNIPEENKKCIHACSKVQTYLLKGFLEALKAVMQKSMELSKREMSQRLCLSAPAEITNTEKNY